ncbi:phosphatase PAP2 family protein [uncultured Fibrobacter sp.]|uniref:phosphatase PAP2 family protein n=1 Tax=uncultured Fibrobacter sp. TaxID=261512 RepID=UPI00262E4E45|nr:phosphatase PAP2 family protein [uncultured Fibrobacter sp.]
MKQSLATFKKILVLVLLAAFASFAHAETPSIDSTTVDSAVTSANVDAAQKLSPLDHLGHNMLLSAFGWPLGFHMLGGALTYKFSMENNDLMVARFAARQDQLVYGIAFTPGMMMGTFFPILVPGYMYFISDNRALNNTGAVAVQATAVAFLYNNILKAISAREHPDAELNSGERSRDFKWGFFRRGVFYGWPSGHSMTNAAMAMSIASYNRDKPLVVAGCALYAGYIATSMVLGAKGEAHWFSDAVAGTLMGASIGWYIGSVFYKEKVGEKLTPPKVTIAPLFYDDTKGAVLSVRI